MAQNPLLTPLGQLPGVGVERAAQLQRLELATVADLLLLRPRRYEDRRHFQRVAALQLDQPALLCGKIIAAGLRRLRGGRSVFELILDDGSWVCFRLSGTEPVVRAYTEVRDEKDRSALRFAAEKFVQG